MRLARTLLLTIALAAGASAAGATSAGTQTCSGTTEELLVCYAPEVKEFLRQWVRSWGEGDIETYLSLYNSIRSPVDGMDRAAWESHRRARVSPDRQIEINLKLESMGLEDSGIFDVVFTQQYESETYKDQMRKRLFLIREAGELRIWKEEAIQ